MTESIMGYKDITELLAAHAEQLNSGTKSNIEHLPISPEQRREMVQLFKLAEQIKDVLTPVKPASSYKRKLRLDLDAVARRQTNRDLRIAPPSPRKELILGAAIGSAVAVAGGIAYVIRTYIQTRSQHVGQAQT